MAIYFWDSEAALVETTMEPSLEPRETDTAGADGPREDPAQGHDDNGTVEDTDSSNGPSTPPAHEKGPDRSQGQSQGGLLLETPVKAPRIVSTGRRE